MIYSNLLKKHYSDWPSLEKAIEALPTAKARGNVFEEFTFAYFTIKKQMYQIAEIYPSADIPDKYRKAFKLGNKQHQDSGVYNPQNHPNNFSKRNGSVFFGLSKRNGSV